MINGRFIFLDDSSFIATGYVEIGEIIQKIGRLANAGAYAQGIAGSNQYFSGMVNRREFLIDKSTTLISGRLSGMFSHKGVIWQSETRTYSRLSRIYLRHTPKAAY